MASNDVTPAIGPNSVDDYRKLSVDDLRTLAISGLHKAIRVDVASSSVTYVGFSDIGTSDASALWRIAKVSVSGAVTSITWADSNGLYDNVWNNRASLSYG